MLLLPRMELANLSSAFFTSLGALIPLTSVVSVIIPHTLLISTFRSLYLDSFSTPFTEVFCSAEMGTWMNMHLLVVSHVPDNYVQVSTFTGIAEVMGSIPVQA